MDLLSNNIRAGINRGTHSPGFRTIAKTLARCFNCSCEYKKNGTGLITSPSPNILTRVTVNNPCHRLYCKQFGSQLIGSTRLRDVHLQNSQRVRFIQSFQSRSLNSLLQFDGVSNSNPGCRPLSIRFYSQHNEDDDEEEPRREMKGLLLYVPYPITLIKNVWYMFLVHVWLDKSFNGKEFLFGAKQAISYLTRLMVLKDFETMKSVASKDVISRMQGIILSPLTSEQQQVLEILPGDISHAQLRFSSIKYYGNGSFTIFIDVLCFAAKRLKSNPLLIKTVVRFGRGYDCDGQGDWIITGVREFTVHEFDMTQVGS